MCDFEKGLVHAGNWFRLKRAMRRAEEGRPVVISFIGGSITQGSLASAPETCYAHLVYSWWAQRYPCVTYINAGIGGTTSQFGAARAEEDVLRGSPDVVFVEFSVNDENTSHFQETYEGLIRKLYRSGAAVVLIHNVCYDTGISAEQIHLQIGKHYDLPCVSMKSTLYAAVRTGKIQNREITPDDLHLNDAGHALVAGVITQLLDKVHGETGEESEPIFPEPLTENAWEESIRHQNHNSEPVLQGFIPDHTPQEQITQMFRRGFTARNKGDKITFLVEGSGIAVQYRKSVRQPAPIARITVDGTVSMILDANFRETWGDCLYLDTVLAHGEDKVHVVEIELIETHANDAVPFYLVSVIGSGMKKHLP